MSSPRVWLITGGSSGFGLELTRLVLRNGDIAVSTYRSAAIPDCLATLQSGSGNLRGSSDSNLLLLPLDLASSDSEIQITNVFNEAIRHFGRIDVVFNNAGIAIYGEIESTSEESARTMFDVNFWGMARVSREAVRVFREINPKSASGKTGGRLLTVSSGAGVVPNAGVGYYCASKHALEGFTDALAQEMDPAWNIKITILEPGAFRTRAHTDNAKASPEHPAYASNASLPTHLVRKWFQERTTINGDPALAAERIFKFASWGEGVSEEKGRVPLRLPLGDDSWKGIRVKLEKMLEEQIRVEQWSKGLEAH